MACAVLYTAAPTPYRRACKNSLQACLYPRRASTDQDSLQCQRCVGSSQQSEAPCCQGGSPATLSGSGAQEHFTTEWCDTWRCVVLPSIFVARVGCWTCRSKGGHPWVQMAWKGLCRNVGRSKVTAPPQGVALGQLCWPKRIEYECAPTLPQGS